MEMAVIGTLAQQMASMIGDKLFQEVSLVIHFKDDFEFICEEVNSINSLLNDARGRKASNSIVNWGDKVQDFLYEAVHLVEECEDREFNCFSILFKCQMGRRIRMLKNRIKLIHDSAKYLKYATSFLDADVRLQAFNAHDLEEQYSRRSAILNISESEPVGMTDDIVKITNWILGDNGYGVIAVVGMGGLGKSHLVKTVFNSPKVRTGFDHLVWLTVSLTFSVKTLLLVTARQYLRLEEEDDKGHKLSNLEVDELKHRINIYLREKSCLFVLDGVWHNEAWQKIGLNLSSDTRNKIVVTTRNKNVADHIGIAPVRTRHVHQMRILSDDDSWKLFRVYADPTGILPAEFPGNSKVRASGQEHDRLTSIACRIVKKCGGLPLAVKTRAASMTKLKMIPNEWESMLHHHEALDRPDEGEGDTAHVMHSLRLSYEALPDRLKPCFLYCSAFPPHSHIKSEYLVHLWIAEGFISTRDAGDGIEVGRSYLNKLINLCMVEISRRVSDGRVKYCRLHDLLHDLALRESKESKKCLFEPGKELKQVPMAKCIKAVRRISLIKNEISTISTLLLWNNTKLRTLLLWNNTKLESIPKKFFDNLKDLVVLDLSQTCIESLPTSIKNAKHLKLLNVSETKISKLPECLSGLKQLQYLDVSGCENLSSLHSGIGEHKDMLHLNVEGCKKLKTLPAGISKLVYLRTLKGAPVSIMNSNQSSTATASDSMQWKDLRGLIRLQHLSVILIKDAQSSASASAAESQASEGRTIGLEGTFEVLTDMRTLYFRNSAFGGLLHLPDDTQRMVRLEKVHLCKCVVPTWMFQLQSLMVLVIEGDNATAEYEGLQKIPNLKKLHLSHNKNCREFPKEFEEPNAFPKLEKLMIEDFHSLEKLPSLEKEKDWFRIFSPWIAKKLGLFRSETMEAAMPMLNHLLMKNCNNCDLEQQMPLLLQRHVKVEVLTNEEVNEEAD